MNPAGQEPNDGQGPGLVTAVVSVAATRRRRYQWAAWWTSSPQRHPFINPDAHGGGAESEAQALLDAARGTGRTLTVIAPAWARAWSRVMQGQPAFRGPLPRGHRPASASPASKPTPSTWAVLGIASSASQEEIKRAYRSQALLHHPDHGGDPEAFRTLHTAYEKAMAKRSRKRR